MQRQMHNASNKIIGLNKLINSVRLFLVNMISAGRNIKRLAAAMTVVLIFSHLPASAEGLNGWLSITSNNSTVRKDGEKQSSADSTNQNYNLYLNNSITPLVSYQLNFRANLTDTHTTDDIDNTTTTYRRTLEPSMTLFLRNSVYDLNTGYRREEKWSTARMSSENRETTEFYFSRFNLNPAALPTLSLNAERQHVYDNERDTTDRTNDLYSISSSYNLPSPDMLFNYYMIYSYGVEKTPLILLDKTTNNNFSISYDLGYHDSFRGNTSGYSVGYQGYFSRFKTTQFLTQTGNFLFQRTRMSEGLYKNSALPADPLNIILTSTPALINGSYSDATGIKLDKDDQNLGIGYNSAVQADRLYIYYRDSGAATGAVTWQVYESSDNNTWSLMPVTSSAGPLIDNDKNAYRYEIIFPATSARFFKVVNTGTPQVGVNFIEISEIEAWGTDNILETQNVNTTNSFNQKLNVSTYMKPLPKLNVSLDYFIERADYNPESLANSATGIFKNIFNDSFTANKSNFTSIVTRNYSMNAVWTAHRLLTTSMHFQKYEHFDNSNAADSSSDTYQLSFNSAPLSTLYTTLSLTRNERYLASEKDSTGNVWLLSIGSQLYKNTNMINDIGYTETEYFSSGSTVSSYSWHGTVDSQITKKLTGNFNYGFDSSSNEDTASDSKNFSMILNYQPGRFINISGNANYTETDGDTTTAEGFSIDWLPLPAVRVNAGFQHTEADPLPTKTDAVSGSGIWYLTKFADIRVASNYTLQKEDGKTESYGFSANLNCRF